MLCDLTLAQVILTFSIGGVSLRVAIAFLKKIFNLQGFLAVALTIACCFLATSLYMAAIGQLTLPCLIIVSLAVYAGTQVAYSVSKKGA